METRSGWRPLDVGRVEQMLVDDHVVEDAWDLRRCLHQPLRHPVGPVLLADRPWEDGIRTCNVLHDEGEGLYHMLYQSVNVEAYQRYMNYFGLQPHPWDRAAHGTPKYVCYARSTDGLQWEKPALEGFPWRDHPRTNVVFPGQTRAQSPEVVWNPDRGDEERRLVMLYRDTLGYPDPQQRDGRCLAYSPDGIHWTPDEANPVTRGGSDGQNPVCWDPETERWFCFCRPKVMAFDAASTPRPSRGNTRRRMAVITSPDLRSWSFPRSAIVPDELDISTFCVEGSAAAFKWGSHFFSFVPISDHYGSGRWRTQLAFSADGYSWSRLPDRPFWLDPGPEGSWDEHAAVPACPPVEMGDNWLIYYIGQRQPALRHAHSFSLTAVGVAVVPRGRLIGRFAGDDDGFLLTRELLVGGRHLEIHCERVVDRDGRPPCEIRVGLARRSGAAGDHRDAGYHEGFALDDCLPMGMTSSALRVRWRGGDDLGALVGKPAFLRFHLRNAGLYSFRFTDGQGP